MKTDFTCGSINYVWADGENLIFKKCISSFTLFDQHLIVSMIFRGMSKRPILFSTIHEFRIYLFLDVQKYIKPKVLKQHAEVVLKAKGTPIWKRYTKANRLKNSPKSVSCLAHQNSHRLQTGCCFQLKSKKSALVRGQSK